VGEGRAGEEPVGCPFTRPRRRTPSRRSANEASRRPHAGAGWPLALSLSAGQARAGVILQAASASTDMGTLAGSPDNVRNQSGLSAGYTSGVTDFDAYLAGNPTHDSSSGATRLGFPA